jgi:uncharacterized protein (TIGR02391 family)
MNLNIDPAIAVKMPTEELAGHVIDALKKGSKAFHPHNVGLAVASQYANHPQKDEFIEAIMEAFGWMYSEGLSITDPDNGYNGWMRLSRRASQLKAPSDVTMLAQREILPKNFLHPVIAQEAGLIFHTGKYDAAVYEAFKQLEIAVKEATGINNIGSALMMDAFKNGTGPLVDKNADPNEEEGLKFVFAGAMKIFRNSTGHRNVRMDAYQAASLIIHASYLYSLVEERKLLNGLSNQSNTV